MKKKRLSFKTSIASIVISMGSSMRLETYNSALLDNYLRVFIGVGIVLCIIVLMLVVYVLRLFRRPKKELLPNHRNVLTRNQSLKHTSSKNRETIIPMNSSIEPVDVIPETKNISQCYTLPIQTVVSPIFPNYMDHTSSSFFSARDSAPSIESYYEQLKPVFQDNDNHKQSGLKTITLTQSIGKKAEVASIISSHRKTSLKLSHSLLRQLTDASVQNKVQIQMR